VTDAGGNGNATDAGGATPAGGARDAAGLADGGATGIVLDGQELGALMMQQLGDLIADWTTVIESLVRHGVDPVPVLRTLAGTLRDTADQLDPPTGR
jgi:hypothetical protein